MHFFLPIIAALVGMSAAAPVYQITAGVEPTRTISERELNGHPDHDAKIEMPEFAEKHKDLISVPTIRAASKRELNGRPDHDARIDRESFISIKDDVYGGLISVPTDRVKARHENEAKTEPRAVPVAVIEEQ